MAALISSVLGLLDWLFDPVDSAPRNLFGRSALASGLVEQGDIDAAQKALRAKEGKAAKQDATYDRRLADQLIELGKLNRYQADQLLAGRTKLDLGSYVIIDFVGQGGMGQVFKARHRFLQREVAIKVLPKSKSTPAAIAGFMQEIRVLAQLDHENLVRAFDAGQDGNVFYLVTEYVPGTDLRRLVRSRGMLGMEEAAAIITQAARGLEHAHQRGLIHRDVKPGNLLVSPDGHTKVSDLGLAGSLDDSDSDPRAGKVVGTADYLSPEQILTPRKLSPASDIYSLGCTLYYAVTGKVPYPGGTTREKARQHCEGTPYNPKTFNPNLSDDFVEAIADLMRKDPAVRLATARDVVKRLKPWAEKTTARQLEKPLAPVVLRSLAGDVPELSDTAESFAEFEEGDDQASGHSSQGTDPVASADQETLPATVRRLLQLPGMEELPPWAIIAMPIGAIVILTLLVVLVWLLVA